MSKIKRLASPEMVDAAEAAARAVLNEQARRRPRSVEQAARALDLNVAGRYLAQSPERGQSVTVLTAAETAKMLRLNLVDPHAAGPTISPTVGLNPTTGDRIASRVNVVELTSGTTVAAARETSSDEAAEETAHGTDLEESSISFDKLTPEFARVGSFIDVDASVLEDRGSGDDVLNTFVRRDVLRAVDQFVLSRDDHGILSDASVTTTPRGSRSRSAAVVDAVAQVRDAGHLGTITVAVNGTDAAALVNEESFKARTLELLGAELVVSALVPTGTALVADLQGVTLWVASPGLSIVAADSHGGNFLSSRVIVRGVIRAFARVQLTSAIQIVDLADTET